MLHYFRILTTVLLLSFLLQACKDPKSGALSPETRTELDVLADDPYKPPSQKYIELSRVMAKLLDEASAKPGDAAAVAHIVEFTTENDAALDRLYGELDKWQKHMENEDRMLFVMNLMAEKSTTTLQNRSRSFRRRISGNPDWLRQYDQAMSYLDFRK
ncbi:MAG: hypothetical protein AAFR87_30265 [Bacteroidota bacterium]